MEKNEIIQVEQAEIRQAINRAEIDQQVATAKQYQTLSPKEWMLGSVMYRTAAMMTYKIRYA